MKTLFWVAVLASAGVLVFIVRYVLRKQAARERASEARAAELLAQMAGAKLAAAPTTVAHDPRPPVQAAAPAPGRGKLETQKLLFEAARRAGEADEPALAIQLYARLLARFPDSAFADEVRAAAEAQKKKLKS
jgi:hypothetical protein